jgi:ABC-2 type transport system ATP-binding protein
VETEGSRSVVDLSASQADDADQHLLSHALAAGPVREFTRQRPSLIDLYRDVVGLPHQQEERS